MGRLQDIVFGKPREPLPPITDERVHQVIALLAEHKATIMTRVVVHRDMWGRWSQGLAEAIVGALTSSRETARSAAEAGNTLQETFGELTDGSLFIMGRDADELTRSSGAVISLNGSHEVYQKRGTAAYSTVDQTTYVLPEKCPVIPLFVGSLWLSGPPYRP